MSNKSRIPGEQRNHLTATEITPATLGKLIAMHGWELGVIWVMKEGEDGGMAVACSGLGLRNGRIAQEFMKRITASVGMDDAIAEDAKKVDAEIETAAKEMAEGTDAEDATIGRRILGDKLERIGADKMKERGRKPN